MRKSLWFYLCSVLTLVAAKCLFCGPAYAQHQATVASVTVNGNPTDGAPASVTVVISRTGDLADWTITASCNPPLVDIDHINCGVIDRTR